MTVLNGIVKSSKLPLRIWLVSAIPMEELHIAVNSNAAAPFAIPFNKEETGCPESNRLLRLPFRRSFTIRKKHNAEPSAALSAKN